MSYTVINFSEKSGKFHDHWSPKVIAEMNDYQFKLAKVEARARACLAAQVDTLTFQGPGFY